MANFRESNLNFFLEQWERVIRWRNQCMVICNNAIHDEGANPYDFYEAFFINAFHLKDWVYEWAKINKRFDLIAKLKDDFNKIFFLMLLRDIANGSKHFTLNKAYIGRQFAIVREYSLGSIQSVILIGGKKYPLGDLANDVFEYWKNFFESNDLNKFSHNVNYTLPFD